ncbi:MAG TPA: AAA family ATPase [Trebonia sp.]|nr:AAA family ATPase [Trebonia sp.]
MLPPDRVRTAGNEPVPLVDGVHAAIGRAPVLVRPVLTVLSVALLPWLFAPICVVRGVRTVMASLYVAAFWAWLYLLISANRLNTHVSPTAPAAHPVPAVPAAWLLALLASPFLVAAVANVRPLSRWFIPCRTVAWSLLWSTPVVFFIVQASPQNTMFAVIAIWVIAAALIGWRAAKGSQEARMFGPDGPLAAHAPGQAGAGATGPGHQGPPPAGPAGPAGGAPGRRTGPLPRNGPGGHSPAQYGTRAQGVAQVYADHATREPQPAAAVADKPLITPEEALAELDAMIGLGPVKEQVRSIAVSIEAARRRAVAGFGTDKPMRHFVFLGPPGTGKTTVARVIGKIFYSFGLLDTPEVVEAQRSDLVGEYLGATAIKTNELIDSALGRVLFIDEAYSLVNEGDGQSDRFGAEAVQTLLKRAEDDRENLIIILAGYEKQTEAFLATNPGMASRFATRIRFPTYSTEELLALAETQLRSRQEGLAPEARPVLWRILDEVGRRRTTDELGNGRFVRTLLEKAGQARDVRVMGGGGDPQAEDLITVGAADLDRAFSELTSRLRGYEDTPTLESAIAELDELVGLEPVKQQVRAIAAQLRVAKLRDRQGLTSQPPARHFVFTGPPGTGKTTVARILGRIFAALGLLVRPEVVEAHRGDLVGEHLGSTSIKTNRLVDSALGGVLFVDEAYSLHNEGYSGGDAFGTEAVQTLLKRAEDDRDRLVIVLAGYPADMDRFLRSNPGLASRFSTRVTFPSYTARDLSRIAVLYAEQAGDAFEPEAVRVLEQIFAQAERAGQIDDLGNGRFARSLFERACACRDVRVVRLGESATAADLTTLTADDVRGAYADLSV